MVGAAACRTGHDLLVRRYRGTSRSSMPPEAPG